MRKPPWRPWPLHWNKRVKIDARIRRSAKHARLVLALAPNEILMELGVRVELLSEEASLALLGLGVLFDRGQIEDQIGDDESLCRLVKPGDVLLAEAGEVDGIDLFSWENQNQRCG